jgi:hypothetical protein
MSSWEELSERLTRGGRKWEKNPGVWSPWAERAGSNMEDVTFHK